MEGEAPEEIENHDLKEKYISELMCDIIEFHDNMGGTSEDISENLHFKGDPELFKEVASTLLLRSLPTNLSSLVEEFVTELPDFETWCQAQDSRGGPRGSQGNRKLPKRPNIIECRVWGVNHSYGSTRGAQGIPHRMKNRYTGFLEDPRRSQVKKIAKGNTMESRAW